MFAVLFRGGVLNGAFPAATGAAAAQVLTARERALSCQNLSQPSPQYNARQHQVGLQAARAPAAPNCRRSPWRQVHDDGKDAGRAVDGRHRNRLHPAREGSAQVHLRLCGEGELAMSAMREKSTPQKKDEPSLLECERAATHLAPPKSPDDAGGNEERHCVCPTVARLCEGAAARV